MGKKPLSNAIAIVVTIIALFTFASAQGTTSRLTGTVTDSSGASVGGATVTLTNEATKVSLTTQTSDSGTYVFDLIQVGDYSVAVEKAGFKKLVSTKNTVNINQPATVNIALEIGDVSAVVTVESTAEIVQTSSSGNIGSTIEQRTLESLPIVGTRGRNPLDLINFLPGVVNGANTGGGVHVNGARDRAFNFTLDGIDINESSAGGSNFTPLRTNPDSLQEFQVVTSGFTAELGRSSGAQVTLVTKSGTNRFAGNAFEYYQTPRFSANEYQNNLNGLAKNQFVQHIYGGSFGGPIVKNKLFFFANIQLLRAYDTALVSRSVLTQSARNGIYRYIVGGTNSPSFVDANGNPTLPNCSVTITTSCIQTYNVNANQVSGGNPTATGIDPALAAVFNSAPLPNSFVGAAGCTPDGLNTACFNFGSPQREKQYDFSTKFDFNLNDKNAFYVRYSQGEQNSFGDSGNGGRPIFPDSPNLVNTFRNPKNLAVNYRWSPTAKFTNEFVFGLNRFAFSFDTAQPDPAIPYTFNLTATPNTNFSYNARKLNTWQFVDNLTFDLSPHTIKAGVNIRFGRQIDDRSSVAGTNVEPIVNFSTAVNGNYTAFNLPSTGINANDLNRLRSYINDVLGRVGNITQAFVADPANPSQFAAAGTRWNFTAYYPELDFYVQDTWKARSNLTFDIGLRYEPKLSPTSDGRPILRPNKAFTIGAAPANDIRWEEGKLFENDLNNFSPTLGFAWDPLKDGKTSIRANYRLSYDRFPSQVFAANIYQNAPGNTFGAANTAFGQAGGLLRNISSVALAPTSTPNALRQPAAFGTGSVTLVDPDLKYPEFHNWTLSFQRELWDSNVLEINYVGTRGTNLFGGYNSNQVDINARDTRYSNDTFLQAFNFLRANPTASHPLINALFTGNAADNTGTTTFRSIAAVSTALATGNTGGGVALAALAVSQRLVSGNQMLATTIGNPFFFQRYTQFTGGVLVLDSNDLSRYNALEVIFKRRIKNGIGFQVSYTMSKSMDTRSFDPTFTTVSAGGAQSASSTPFDINNRDLNYAWSDFDRRHVLQGTYVYELPFGRGKYFASEIPKAVDWVIGGWQMAGTLNLASGRPFTIFSGTNTLSNAVQSTVNCNACSRSLGSVFQDLGTNYFFTVDERTRLMTQPNPGELGETGRNYFIGPKQFQLNLSLSKKFRFTERYSFDLRLDTTNLTNTPSFAAPNAIFNSSTAPIGRIRDSVTSASRRVQFSGKLNF